MGPDPEHVLTGRRIIITRSVVDNESLGATLRSFGADLIEVPLVEVLPPLDGGSELRAIADRLRDYDWVILTSVNAVDALAGALSAVDPQKRWPSGLWAAAVGPTTAAAATAAGLTVQLVPDTATAAALVDVFPSPTGSGQSRILAPLAELAGPTVSDGLTAKGYRVDRVTAYRTAAPSDPEPDVSNRNPGLETVAGADAVAFFSPSVVDRFVARFGPVPGVAVCIGPSTAERAMSRGFAEVDMAERHTEQAVVELICDRFGVRY